MTVSSFLAKQRVLLGCTLAALLLVGFGWASYGKSAAQGAEGNAQAPLSFSSGGTINFQGQLTTLAGAALNGDYNLRFAIYDAPSAGNKRWPAGAYEEHPAVPVTDGLFSVQLGSLAETITAAVFNGGGNRYLQVWVCTAAGAGCTTYDDMGRLPLSGGAYAQTLALPAALEAAAASTLLSVTNTGSGGALMGLSSATTGDVSGVYGRSDSTDGVGIFGSATATSGLTNGVMGASSSTAGRGVYGHTLSASGVTFGVYGRTESANGSGVYGHAPNTGGATRGVSGSAASTSGTGVYGEASAVNGTTYGVYGQAASAAGRGVYGRATHGSGTTSGVYGESASTAGIGVSGAASASSGATYGMRGESASNAGSGVLGVAGATSGVTNGIYGWSYSTSGRGVYGYASQSSGTTYGVYGRSNSTDGAGVYGYVSHNSGVNYGVYGESASASGRGVYGYARQSSGATYGVYGESASAAGAGVYGYTSAGSGTTYGVYGRSNSTNGYGGKFDGYGADVVYVENLGTGRGIQAYAPNDTAIWASTGSGVAGVDGRASGATGRGVYGYATADSGVNYGVYGRTNSPAGYAGYFAGNLRTTGALSKAAGSFQIDHPLDPANKYLAHSFVESPDMKNIYDGVAMLDADGQATVSLPDWFEALNRDFRYQLTPIGAAMPTLHIAQEIQANQFRIAGGQPGAKVSWQVTGTRQDAYANAHRIVVEEEKPAGERGTYLHPAELGQPAHLGLDYHAAGE